MIRKVGLLNFLVIIYIVVIFFTPLRGTSYYNYLKIIPFLWIIIAFLKNKLFFLKAPVYRFVLVIFTVYTIATPYLFGNGVIGNRYMDLFGALFFLLVYQFNHQNGNDFISKRIVYITFPLIVCSVLATLIVLRNHPFAARSLLIGRGEITSGVMQFIGGYDLIYFLVFLIIILANIFFSRKILKLSYKQLCFICSFILLFLYLVFKANFFTALVAVSIGLFLVFFLQNIKSSKIVFYVLLLSIIYLFKDLLANFVLTEAIDLFSDGLTKERLILIRSGLFQSTSVNLYEDRGQLLENAINGIFENPIIGNFDNVYIGNSGYLVGAIGQHSTLVDTYSLFGIIIGSVYLYLLVQPFFERFSSKMNKVNALTISMGLVFFIVLLGNNLTPTIGYAVFFIYPLVFDAISHNN